MRKIDELIWHCTATPEGREVTLAEVDSWHKARGWSGVGYHKLVHLDGSISQGRPESQVGSHVANRNARTIGYCYVGGIDADNKGRGEDTRTAAQKITMERLTREAIKRYGLKMVSGHRDYAPKACPCFDARAEYAHLLHLPVSGMPDRDPWTDMREISESRTVKGATMAGGGGAGLSIDNGMQLAYQLTEADAHISAGTVIGLIVGLIILSGALWALYARWDDAGRPLPAFLRSTRKVSA